MKTFISSSLYPNTSITNAINKCQKNFGNRIEISAPHKFQSIEELKKIFELYKEKKIEFLLHNYFPSPKKDFVLNISTTNKDIFNKSIDLVNNAINISNFINSKIYGIHAGYFSDSYADQNGNFVFEKKNIGYLKSLENSVKFINKIIYNARKKNVKLLLENLFPFNKEVRSLFCNFDQINDLMKELPEDIGLLLDLGHLQISCNFFDLDIHKEFDKILNTFSDRIYEIHVSENDGIKDIHKVINKNSWQIKALKKIKECTTQDLSERQICLEVRNESVLSIKKCLSLMDDI